MEDGQGRCQAGAAPTPRAPVPPDQASRETESTAGVNAASSQGQQIQVPATAIASGAQVGADGPALYGAGRGGMERLLCLGGPSAGLRAQEVGTG